MIRTILGLAVAGIALAPFAEKSDGPWVAEYGVDPIVTSVGTGVPAVRHLKVATSAGDCILSVTNAAAVRAEPSCGEVYAGLEKAAQWSAHEETARIADASGQVILEVGASDGFAYESTGAAASIVTLTEIDI